MKQRFGLPIRYKSAVRRRFRKKLKRQALLEQRKEGGGSKTAFKPSHIISLLRKEMTGALIGAFRPVQRDWVIPIPKIFSLIDNPDESLNVIYTLVSVSRDARLLRIHFDHSKCEQMDIGASVLLEVATMEVRNEWTSKRQPRTFSGKFPKNEKVKEIFICTGLYRRLGLRVPDNILAHYEIYPLFSGKRARGDQSKGDTDQVKAATKLAEHIDKCLSYAGYRLADDDKGNIARWAGELIANAEDHSGEDTWYVIAHMDKAVEGVNGECHLAVLGFGQSIYQSLNNDKTPEETKKPFRALTEKHATKGFFDKIFSGGIYREQDLWTMYALQERVSCLNGKPGFFDRGTGTIEMIDAFQSFGGSVDENKQPKMAMISGDSRIVFDGRYKLSSRESANGEMHQIIAFNDACDLEERPDIDCVHGLRNFFPGTIITFRFFVDEQHLASQLQHVAKNN